MSAIQVKDVPEELHEQLRVRAQAAGCTLGEYVLRLVQVDLQRPVHLAWLAELAARPTRKIDSRIIREELDEVRRSK